MGQAKFSRLKLYRKMVFTVARRAYSFSSGSVAREKDLFV
jgi:hypothetical protein